MTAVNSPIIVANPSDHVAVNHHLHAVHHPQRGRIVVRPTPAPVAAHTSRLALDVLAALGKDTRSLGKVTDQSRWDLAASWLEADRIRHLIVDRAHLLPAQSLIQLADLAAAGPAQLWLIWGNFETAPPLDDRPTEVIDLVDFIRQLPAIALSPVTEREPWPPMPHTNFATFLAVCRRTLPRAEFDRVADLYHQVASQAVHLLRTLPLPPHLYDRHYRSRPENLLFRDIYPALRDQLLGPAICPHEALIRLRACQAGMLREAVYLHWEPCHLGLTPAARLPTDLSPSVAALLCDQVRPDRAVAAMIRLHLNERPRGPGSVGWPTKLTVDDVDLDNLTVRCGENRQFTLPIYVRAAVEALLAWRRRQGAGPATKLFSYSDVSTDLLSHLKIPDPAAKSIQYGKWPQVPWLARRALSIHQMPRRLLDQRGWDYQESH